MLNNLYNLIDNKNSLYFCYTYNRQFFLDFKRISLINNIKLLLILYVAYSENYAFNFTNLVRTDVNFISFFFFNAYGLNFINYYNIYFKFYMNLFIELNKRFLYWNFMFYFDNTEFKIRATPYFTSCELRWLYNFSFYQRIFIGYICDNCDLRELVDNITIYGSTLINLISIKNLYYMNAFFYFIFFCAIIFSNPTYSYYWIARTIDYIHINYTFTFVEFYLNNKKAIKLYL